MRGILMARFFKNRPLVITIIAILVLVILMALTSNANDSISGQGVVGSFFSKVQVFFYDTTNAMGDFFAGIFSSRDIDRENVDLKKMVQSLEEQMLTYDETLQENERLKQLLNYTQQNDEYTYTAARVVAKEPGVWFNSFTINAGKNQGVLADMAVVNSKGLVGRVTEVYGSSCKVVSIIDYRSSIHGVLERTRISGLVEGKVQGDVKNAECRLTNLPYETELLPGDKIVTSGLNDMLPKGILIGEVAEVPAWGAAGEYATVKMAVDFLEIEEVLVITGKKE
jgi:rod shape-determining protein MreC